MIRIDRYVETLSREAGNKLNVFALRIKRLLREKASKSLIDAEINRFYLSVEFDKMITIYQDTAKEFIKEIKRLQKDTSGIVFNEIDKDILDSINDSFFWMLDDTSKAMQDDVKMLIEDMFTGDIPRYESEKILRDMFSEVINKNESYFKGVIDHIILQGQNLCRVSQGNKYGITAYEIYATIDNRTTPLCKSLNGRIIPANQLNNQMSEIINAKTKEDKKAAAPWTNTNIVFGKNQVLPASIGFPPYHFRCRTQLLPYFETTGGIL